MLLDNILSYIVIFILKKLKNSQGPFGTIVNDLFTIRLCRSDEMINKIVKHKFFITFQLYFDENKNSFSRR